MFVKEIIVNQYYYIFYIINGKERIYRIPRDEVESFKIERGANTPLLERKQGKEQF